MNPPKSRPIMLLLLPGGFVIGFTLVVIGPLETWIVGGLGISHTLAGLTQTAFFAGNVGGSLFAAWITRRTNPMTLGLALVGVMADNYSLTLGVGASYALFLATLAPFALLSRRRPP